MKEGSDSAIASDVTISFSLSTLGVVAMPSITLLELRTVALAWKV
jgi:hypothetical protein